MTNQELKDHFAAQAARDKKLTAAVLAFDRELMKLQVGIQDARNKLNGLANVDRGDAVHLPAHHDADGQPAKRKRADTKVSDDAYAKVFNLLGQLGIDYPDRDMKPSGMRSVTGLGRKTIAAICKRLVAEGRATAHRGAYRIAPAAPYDGSAQ